MTACKECGKEFNSDIELHRHLKAHKLSVAFYYYKHFPRYDLHDKKLIDYRNKDQYFSTSFNSRANFVKWWKSQGTEAQKDYALEFLKERKEKKGLIYAPSHVELRSLLCPWQMGYDRLFGDYYKLCFEIGLRVKYEKFIPKENSRCYVDEVTKGTILVDTREQNPLCFDQRTQIASLTVGDYGFQLGEKQYNYFFERKSLADFISSFGREYERIRKEIERAMLSGYRLIILVEQDLKHALAFDEFKGLSHRVQVTPEFIFHNVRELIQEFPHIQFLFTQNREESARVIKKLFYNEEYLRYDLQFLYDSMNL